MTSRETTSTASDRSTGEDITVWVGVPTLAKGSLSSGSLLVVEAEPQRARELKQVLLEQQEALVCEEVLAAEHEATVSWHLFNDARLNGPIDLMIWQQLFPNLRQIDQEQRCGRRLGDLLENWIPRQGERALAHLHLVLRQGDPLAALTGLGPWLSQLETVQLMLPWPSETMRQVKTWLAKQGFRQDPQSEALWTIDQVAKRDWLLNEKEKEKQSLLAINQQLNRNYESLRTDKDLLAEELKILSTELKKLKEIHDLAQADIHQSRTENEKIKIQQDNLQQACLQLNKEKAELLQQLETAEAAVVNSIKACKTLFPMQLYREGDSILGGYDDDSLLIHYIQHGQFEGRLQTYQELDIEWKASIKSHEEAVSKLQRLEAQFTLAQQQLETLKELFARLADRRESR